MAKIALWGRALRVIPRVSQTEWQGLDLISRWLIATRAAVFMMTATSAGIGGLLAARDGYWSWSYFVACTFGLVFAHATNNLINDFTDHKKGVDRDNYFRTQYGPQPLEHGLLTERQMLGYIGVTGALAILCGSYLVVTTGLTTLWLLIAGAFFVLFYTWPLKHIGLGEPAVLLVWGPLMISGTYYVVSGGTFSWPSAIVGTIWALGPTAVLFGKHTDKLIPDRDKKIRTLPVLLGEKTSRIVVIVMLSLQMVGTLVAVFMGILGLPLLVVVIALHSLVLVARVFVKPRPDQCPKEFPKHAWPTYLVAYAFVYNRRFGLLFLAGLIVDVLLKKFPIIALNL